VILGAGDRGTAAALRLFNSGFQPILLELAQPSDLHFIRNFADVIYCEHKTIDNIQARVIMPDSNEQVLNEQLQQFAANRSIAVINTMSEGDQSYLRQIKPGIIIDSTPSLARAEKSELNWSDYPCVIRIGLNYNVGEDGHYVIGDSQHYQGIVFCNRHQIVPDNTLPENVLKSPLSGIFQTSKRIGDEVNIGLIDKINIMASHDGYISGLLHSGHFVQAGQPLFELISYQKSRESLTKLPVNCWSIAGGVLEAVMRHLSALTH
jgi:xanthine dehydrogenase accessory factor